MKDYILGSHNSWSYLPPKHWWMRPFSFMARCQNTDIKAQYELGVRCFDLRVRYTKRGRSQVAHGFMVYDIGVRQLFEDLLYLNQKGDCFVRLIHEARTKKQWEKSALFFRGFCVIKEEEFPNITFWCGKNLYNWTIDYEFGNSPSCEENYSSVSKPKLIDDWWPWLYAKLHNRKILAKGTDKDILLIDYVNIK